MASRRDVRQVLLAVAYAVRQECKGAERSLSAVADDPAHREAATFAAMLTLLEHTAEWLGVEPTKLADRLMRMYDEEPPRRRGPSTQR